MGNHDFSEEKKQFVESMRQPFVVCEFTGNSFRSIAVSDGFLELFGYKDREQAYSDMSRNMFKNVHPDDTAGFTNALVRFGADDGRLDIVYRTKRRNSGGYTVIHLSGEKVASESGKTYAELWFTNEGDYREEDGAEPSRAASRTVSEESQFNSSHYDYLTGLPNMSYFFERADIERKKMAAQGGSPALLFIDLLGMKRYNHKYGFSAGDRILRSFAALVSKTFGVEDSSHINADHFAAFSDERGLEDRLGSMFREWQDMDDSDGFPPISVGIYLDRMGEVSAGMAYDRAKLACDTLRGTYVSAYNYYSEDLSESLEKQQYILENFDKALSEKWIQVYYQPIIRAVSGKVCDEEALARWIDPEKGFLSPADFIPYLEDSSLIYKLDLYMLDRVLEDIKTVQKEGFFIVSHSINLSRSDFDACDMVEEIRKRVDDAGVARDRISIEITESTIGSDFEFMRNQIERFRALGFPVWMDDFGSGYSSLDVLQSVKFNLLKFDMNFMQKLDESADGRTILTELMKMAMALGIDTICEGVETDDQVRFLQEIGCSKLQGFYFSKPTPFDEIIRWHKAQAEMHYEDPKETGYFELLGGVNLYDVGVIAREEKTSLTNTYNTLPMCIIEVKDDSTRFIRTNQSYRDFFKRFFDLDLSTLGPEFVKYDAAFMHNVVKTCCEQGLRTFYDEKMPDGSIVHSFARRIATDPVTGIVAVAVAVLSVREPNEKLMVDQILSVIEQFGEYMPGGFFIYRADEKQELLYANKAVCDIFGCDSLSEFKELTGFTFRGMVHPDDYDTIMTSIKNQIYQSRAGIDFVEYRIIRKDGEVRWLDDYGHYIEYDENTNLYYVFISDVTDKYEKEESDKALSSAVIEALTKAYDSVWLISDIETEKFELFRIDKELEHMIPANVAEKINKFSEALAFYSRLVLEEDRQRFLESVAIENILKNTESSDLYSVPFRRVFRDGVKNYRLEFTRLELSDGKKGIVGGFKNVDKEHLEEKED